MGASGLDFKSAAVITFISTVILLTFIPDTNSGLEENQNEPVLIVIDQGKGFVHISWELPEGTDTENLTGFRIYRAVGNATLESLILENPEVKAYNDTDVENGQPYVHAVAALYGSEMEEALSDTVTSTPGGPPSPPLQVSLDPTNSDINVTWRAPADDGGFPIQLYSIQRKVGNQSFQNLITRSPDQPFFLDRNLEEGESYSYRIIAINERGPSPLSEEVSYRIPLDPLAPTPPRDLAAETGDLFIHLRWSPPQNEGTEPVLGYKVYRRMEQGPEEKLATLSASTLDYNDTLVVKDTNYTYTIVAYNTDLDSEPSRKLTIRIPAPEDPSDPGGNEEDDNYGTRNAVLLGGAVAIILIGGAVVFYLKMTRNLDQEELPDYGPEDLRPEEEEPEQEDEVKTGEIDS